MNRMGARHQVQRRRIWDERRRQRSKHKRKKDSPHVRLQIVSEIGLVGNTVRHNRLSMKTLGNIVKIVNKWKISAHNVLISRCRRRCGETKEHSGSTEQYLSSRLAPEKKQAKKFRFGLSFIESSESIWNDFGSTCAIVCAPTDLCVVRFLYFFFIYDLVLREILRRLRTVTMSTMTHVVVVQVDEF